jgi:hypothetical protein
MVGDLPYSIEALRDVVGITINITIVIILYRTWILVLSTACREV